MTNLEHITQLAEKLPASDQQLLIERLVQRLRIKKKAGSRPIDMYGAWKGKFPDDMDAITQIREIRNDWKKKLEIDRYE
jgi:hypothetical protein